MNTNYESILVGGRGRVRNGLEDGAMDGVEERGMQKEVVERGVEDEVADV